MPSKYVLQNALHALNNARLPARTTKPQIPHGILDEENEERLSQKAEMLFSRAMTLTEWAEK